MTALPSIEEFIASSPSSYHAAENIAAILDTAGFTRQDETDTWQATPGGHYMVRGGALMAWWVPENASPATSGFRIIGSHTDSPGLKLKPTISFDKEGFHQAPVEIYGGPILASWLDRELQLAGQIVDADGNRRLVATGPVLRVPHLAIHLYRQDELKLERQQHMQPIYGLVESPELATVLEGARTHDLITADTQPPRTFGIKNEFLAAGRLDNLSSVYPSLEALLDVVADSNATSSIKDVLVLAAFDHEEIGSSSRYGAAGPILEDVLKRTAYALGAGEDDLYAMFARSSCISADAAHSVHPNFASKHDPNTHPVLGAGPVLKVNANQRYASDARSNDIWLRASEKAGVAVQQFVGNNDVPCGSTIGPITATRLGILTVDVGIPLLSMHSAREMCAYSDLKDFAKVLAAYYTLD